MVARFRRPGIGSKIPWVCDWFEGVQRVSHSGLWQSRYFLPLPQGQGLLLPRFNFLYRFSSDMYCWAAASNPNLWLYRTPQIRFGSVNPKPRRVAQAVEERDYNLIQERNNAFPAIDNLQSQTTLVNVWVRSEKVQVFLGDLLLSHDLLGPAACFVHRRPGNQVTRLVSEPDFYVEVILQVLLILSRRGELISSP